MITMDKRNYGRDVKLRFRCGNECEDRYPRRKNPIDLA